MAQILVVKPGALNRADKARLRRADIAVVETFSPDTVRLLSAEGPPIDACAAGG